MRRALSRSLLIPIIASSFAVGCSCTKGKNPHR